MQRRSVRRKSQKKMLLDRPKSTFEVWRLYPGKGTSAGLNHYPFGSGDLCAGSNNAKEDDPAAPIRTSPPEIPFDVVFGSHRSEPLAT